MNTATVSIRPSLGILIGVVLILLSGLLYRNYPRIHQRYFRQFPMSNVQSIGGPAMLLAIGILVIASSLFHLV
jgi:uncharacterized membrane protein YidH (DUF202 family)